MRTMFRGWMRTEVREWTAPLALLLAAVLCYGLRLGQVGFYWDDWPYLYLYRIGGFPALYNSLGADRPALSWLYAATLGLLGASPLAWQVFALFARWLLGCAFWLALRPAWREGSGGPFWAALLFTVYPGFGQQWIGVVWGNAFVLYALVFLSLALSGQAARRWGGRNRWFSLIPGLGLSAFVLFSTEYFFGLELLRPVLVWMALGQSGINHSQSGLSQGQSGLAGKRRLRAALLSWLPYLGLLAGFAAWRAFFQPSQHAGLALFAALAADPARALAGLAGRVAQDAALALAAAWGQALALAPQIRAAGVELALFGVLACGLAAFYLLRMRSPAADAAAAWGRESLLLGGYAFLAAGMPVWLAGLPLRLEFPWDRYTLSLSAGAALAAAGLAAWTARTPAARAVLLGILVGSSAAFHNANALDYRRDWNETRELFWQLTWRMPGLQPGTALLADGTGLRYSEDDSLSAPLNWIYGDGEINYIFMNIPERLKTLSYLAPDRPFEKGYRGALFRGTTGRAVVLLTDPRGCLQVLDPELDGWRADLPEFARRALPLSRPDLILTATEVPAVPPADIFGPEPRRKWCYYYQQAALAAQREDWEGVIRIKREAFDQGFKPMQASEFLVFIQAEMRVSAWGDAEELSRAALALSASVQPAVCQAWRAAAWGAESESYRLARSSIPCPE